MTLKKKDMNTRVARWILLHHRDYDYTIEHRSGSKMRHVDALSRNPYVGVITKVLHNQIMKAQEKDEGLKVIREVLKENNYEDYFLENGVIYKGVEKI